MLRLLLSSCGFSRLLARHRVFQVDPLRQFSSHPTTKGHARLALSHPSQHRGEVRSDHHRRGEQADGNSPPALDEATRRVSQLATPPTGKAADCLTRFQRGPENERAHAVRLVSVERAVLIASGARPKMPILHLLVNKLGRHHLQLRQRLPLFATVLRAEDNRHVRSERGGPMREPGTAMVATVHSDPISCAPKKPQLVTDHRPLAYRRYSSPANQPCRKRSSSIASTGGGASQRSSDSSTPLRNITW